MSDPLSPTPMTRLRRAHERGHFDRATIHAILDAQPLAHIGHLVEGRPVVTPTLQWREGERVYWHGSSASRMIRAATDAEICLTVSALDGLVLARSGFHHSANYRAAMIFGKAEKIEDPGAKAAHLKTFIDGLYPGRWDTLRPMTSSELKATTVLSLPIAEASAKMRTGGPKDDEDDYALPIWAGVVPFMPQWGAPEPDPRNLDGVEMPAYVTDREDA